MRERLLVFERSGWRFGVPASRVSEVALARPAQPVPSAPWGVAGVVLEKGRLLTVVDVDRLLGIDGPGVEEGYFLLLASPLAHVAFRVAADVRVEIASDDVEVIDPESAILDLERAIGSGVG